MTLSSGNTAFNDKACITSLDREIVQSHVPDNVSNNEIKNSTCLYSLNVNKNVLLSTVKVKVMRSNGKWLYFNALLDSGSLENLITKGAANLLGSKVRI